MLALTLWRPWDQAMVHGGKRVENRRWALPARHWGRPIALHAGRRYDREGALWMARECGYTPPADADSPGGVVAVVTFDRVVHAVLDRDDPMRADPWFIGPYGWVVGTLMPLAGPIPCRGGQGLWKLPPDVVCAVQCVLAAQREAHLAASHADGRPHR
ncbi:MAG: hypothetical protein WC683_00920 [bacterium]